MHRRTIQYLVGSSFAFGWALTAAMAQHDVHGRGHHTDAKAAETTSTALPKCPVSGEPVNFAVSVPTDDGPVFFCCKDCISKYKADPAKYAKEVAAQRAALAARPKIQVTCPVTGEPVDPNVSIESNGTKVYFCCKGCVKKYERDPKKYAAALANSYTYQTKCPVMGEEIDPKTATKAANGMNIYFCCKGCEKKFFADPAKYAPNLVAQGYTVVPGEMAHDADSHKGHDHNH